MKILEKENLSEENLPGRTIRKAVGKEGPSVSSKMTVGFARYSAVNGRMQPHQHAEEVCYILDAENGRVRYGPSPDQLSNTVNLSPGMILHVPPMEWHVFEYEEGGFVEILFIYGQVDNIRPEEDK